MRPSILAVSRRCDGLANIPAARSVKETNMSDETKPAGLWQRTKAWADKNRTISGALAGGAAGTIVPGVGTVIGAIVGAGVGFASSKEKKEATGGTLPATHTASARKNDPPKPAQ
jgi:hypothetical protein